MDDVSEDEGVVDITLNALILLREVCFPGARERLDDLSGRDEDVWLHDDH